jgi:dTDP-6-deoxy-L-talose 4-dehydrogenase (NAD+)
MKLLVSGATGFLGSHLVPLLLQNGHSLTVLVREPQRVSEYPWLDLVTCWKVDIHNHESWFVLSRLDEFDALVHLAWQGLPRYGELFHVEVNFPADGLFLAHLIKNGLKRILVTGTCFEYGMRSGALAEDLTTSPANAYALAKDCLCKYLQLLQQQYQFTLQWTRLFYIYGQGQNSLSLFAQLQAAIDHGEPVFNMSMGEQLRDYLPVKEVVSYLAQLIEKPALDGIVNICSGKPISIRRLVECYIAEQNASIELNLGYYPYSVFEPMAFWGSTDKLNHWLNQS